MRRACLESSAVVWREGCASTSSQAKKADAQLVLPFKGLTTLRDQGKVTGVTVDSVAVKAGGEQKQGKATVSLEEKDGKFTVTGVTVE